MKSGLSILCFLMSISAHAKLPFLEVETLRRQIVVVRVALDNPQSKVIKSCKMKTDATTLNAKLTGIQENFSKPWKKAKIGTEDLSAIDSKSQNCEVRASCPAYETFVSAAQVDPAIQSEVELLKAALDKKTKELTADNYLAAWKTVPKPCEVLRKVLRAK
jgi:hypothetical protein